MTALYNLKSNSKGWQITKFDEDLNPDTSYAMHYVDKVLCCSCPQMAKPKCRHRTMFPEFVLKQRIDTNWFFDYDTRQWRQYVGDDATPSVRPSETTTSQSPANPAPTDAGEQAAGEQTTASPSPAAQPSVDMQDKHVAYVAPTIVGTGFKRRV